MNGRFRNGNYRNNNLRDSNTVPVEVVTAIPLEEGDKLKLGQRLTDRIGQPVRLIAKVDPDLIGACGGWRIGG